MNRYLLLTVAAVLQFTGAASADTTTLGGFTDTYIVMDRDSTPDTQPQLIVEGYHCSSCIDQRALMKFNLSDFAADATISKAHLKLYCQSQPRPGGATIRVYRMSRAWDAAKVNWNFAAESVLWNSDGGDFNATAVASYRYTDQINVWHTYDVTELVKKFIADPSTDFGIMLMMDPTMKTVGYASSESPKAEQRPKLAIDFVPGSAAVISTPNAAKSVRPWYRFAGRRIELSFNEAGSHPLYIGRMNGTVLFTGSVEGRQPMLLVPEAAPGIYILRAGDGTLGLSSIVTLY